MVLSKVARGYDGYDDTKKAPTCQIGGRLRLVGVVFLSACCCFVPPDRIPTECQTDKVGFSFLVRFIGSLLNESSTILVARFFVRNRK